MLHFSSYFSSFGEISTILGILLIHACALCIGTMFLVFSTARFLVRTLLEPYEFRFFVRGYAFCIGSFHLEAFINFSWRLYRSLHPEAKQYLWQSTSHQQTRSYVLYIFWFVVEDYQKWKSAQLEAFHELTAGHSNTLKAGFNSWWEIWSDLPLVHKLLIAAPAVVFYGYFCVIPFGRRVLLLIRRWRLQYRYR
ncbi:hypothetical protein DFH09DRAFT_133023 [Mycena vulgaris]|nr:hypothetical protein DFH09DRAFT_133023 [Mycena vulgaris]